MYQIGLLKKCRIFLKNEQSDVGLGKYYLVFKKYFCIHVFHFSMFSLNDSTLKKKITQIQFSACSN